jgi:primosomal protein N' (replication factor Y) (superfamily II helicase)
VEVALPLPVHQTFTYRVDGPLPRAGSRVLVPFQRAERVGWVLGPGDPEGIRGIRPVLDVLDREPTVPPDLLALARWMSEYYVTPLGITLRSLLPSVLSDGSREVLRVATGVGGGTPTRSRSGPAGSPRADASGPEASAHLTSRARKVLEAVASRRGEVRVAPLRKALGMGSIWPEIRALTSAGLLEHETLPPPDPPVRTRKVVRIERWILDLGTREETFGRAARQQECFELLEASGGGIELAVLQDEHGFSRSVIGGLEGRGLVRVADEEVLRDPFRDGPPEPASELTPTPAQASAIADLVGALDEERPAPRLLRGITGSGKTLVYIEVLKEVVEKRGGSAIVLVPEIALTPQTVSRFRTWFGEGVAVLHSALSQGERYDQWRQIRAGEKPVVVGARSALFAPVRELGAVVVDEEHDGSYKQSEAPRYHARDVAVVRARMAGALCVLGSATPSLESWRNALGGRFRLLTLPERAKGQPLPPVRVVDIRTRGKKGTTGPEGPARILSPELTDAVQARLRRGEQTILLLNRRGYSSFVQCRACGEVQECPHCSVSLTFHRGRGRLLCHHCRYEQGAPDRCPACGDPDLSFRGLGTEQVERVVAETFPRARIARMDVDTTSGKWAHHEILGRVERGEVDILLGTQMIAKGLDFPRVTLVGVVNADVGLHLPDFRASERSFQLLSQVAGRTGRGELGGEVLIQTALPGHYAIQAALSHDFPGFAERELMERTAPAYPPHVRMVNVVVSSPDPEAAASGAEEAARWIGALIGEGADEGRKGSGSGPEGSGRGPFAGIRLVGPAPCPIERLHGRWRWHFFLRGGTPGGMTRLLRGFAQEFQPPAGDIRVAVDRDPVALL